MDLCLGTGYHGSNNMYSEHLSWEIPLLLSCLYSCLASSFGQRWPMGLKKMQMRRQMIKCPCREYTMLNFLNKSVYKKNIFELKKQSISVNIYTLILQR